MPASDAKDSTQDANQTAPSPLFGIAVQPYFSAGLLGGLARIPLVLSRIERCMVGATAQKGTHLYLTSVQLSKAAGQGRQAKLAAAGPTWYR
jgi:hypothetical protein